ncbi:hypothetical protein Dimus_020526 [Dionaea muscipula]
MHDRALAWSSTCTAKLHEWPKSPLTSMMVYFTAKHEEADLMKMAKRPITGVHQWRPSLKMGTSSKNWPSSASAECTIELPSSPILGKLKEEGPRGRESKWPSSQTLKAEHGDGSMKAGDKLAPKISCSAAEPMEAELRELTRTPMEAENPPRPSSRLTMHEGHGHKSHAWRPSMSQAQECRAHLGTQLRDAELWEIPSPCMKPSLSHRQG